MGICECKKIIYYGMDKSDVEQEEYESRLLRLHYRGSSIVAVDSKYLAFNRTLIFFHGNSENAFQAKNFTDLLEDELKVNVVIAEYPGYGLMNQQEPSEELIYQQAAVLYQYIARKVSDRNVLLVGRSLGSGPATYLSGKFKPAGLVLISPFVSLQEVAVSHVKCCGYCLKDSFNNIDNLRQAECPILVIHGEQDEVVDISQGRKLVSELTRLKKTVQSNFARGMTHNRFKIRRDVILPVKEFIKGHLKWY